MRPARMALVGAAALGALYAAGLLYEIALAPPGCCGLAWPNPDPAQAERILTAADPKGVDAAAQHRAAVAVLAAGPANVSAWMRLAYADRLKNGRLTDAGARALEMSYLVKPYAGPQVRWRLLFAFDNWSRLSIQTRQAVMAELNISLRDTHTYNVAPTQAAGARITDPGGRLAAALLGFR